MPTLVEARENVRQLSTNMLDIAGDAAMTPSEQRVKMDKIEPDLKRWMQEVRDLEYVEQKRKEYFGNDKGHDASEINIPPSDKSFGQQFVESAGYKSLIQRGLGGSRWTTGDVELGEPDMKTLLTTGGGGASLVAQPALRPGILPVLTPDLVVADLLPTSSTDSVLIRYLVETAFTNGAASVAEGGLKPESAIAFDKHDETIHKVATFLPVTDEMLEDYSQIQGYINNRLRYFVTVEEQNQLLNGDGTGSNVLGLANRAGLAAPVVMGSTGHTTELSMDAVYRQITAIRWTSYLEPDAIVIDPYSWAAIMTLKNSQGNYYASGPFVGSQPATLWGKRVVVTPALAQGTALVGSFSQGAMMFRKGGLTVEASNSHADFFQKNLTAIRAEERIGLAVFRPQGFGFVTSLAH